MKVAIVGSRTFNDFERLETFIKNYIDVAEITTIISGGARGADTLAETFAKKYNIPTEIYHPNWYKFGKRAGFIRNKSIVIACDILMAFWDGKSKGTKNSIELALKHNKEYEIVNF